jgi:uncharacterized membrane protein
MDSVYFWAAFWSLMPISELRGAIPYAMASGWPWWQAWLWCAGFNILAAPIAYLFLATAHRLLYHWPFYARIFDRVVERARRKVHDKVEKFGYLGVAVFVGIPLPITGAWTGVLGSWILGLSRRKTFLAVILGVAISATIVTAVTSLGLGGLAIFTKELH